MSAGPIISALPRTLGDLLSDKGDAARVAAAVDKLAGRGLIDQTDLKRSEWFMPGTDPWEGGVYEVEFVPKGCRGFARFFKQPPAAGRTHWSALYDTPEEASFANPGGPLRPKWRGITEAQARELGVV